MIVSSITLKYFRTHLQKTFELSAGTTVIIGPNAVGKTNILEAIVMASTGKSFRAETDHDVITWNHEYSRIHCDLIDDSTVEIVITNGTVKNNPAPRKKYYVHGVSKRMIDFVGIVKTVLFWPEHLSLIIGSPSIRRKYLDTVLIQVDREYARNLLSYEKGLRQRNKVLEKINEGMATRSQLIFWDQLLIKTGSYITDLRSAYIEYVNTTSQNDFPYTLVYDKSIISSHRLLEYADAEVAAHTTLVGPHRDDFQCTMKKGKGTTYVDISQYGSRGEQRLAVLWLKYAELEFIKEKTEDRPTLLLDDIFSELDEKHRVLVWKLVAKQQTIIASADLHEIPDYLRSDVQVIQLP
jgi:DNA replication and repair protein RecF